MTCHSGVTRELEKQAVVVVDKIMLGVLGIMLLLGVKNQLRRVRSAFDSGRAERSETDESK